VLAGFPATESGSRTGDYANGAFSSGRVSRELTGDSGSAARFFYCAKASQEDRNEGCEGVEPQQQDESRKEGNPGGDNPRNRGLSLRANNHPTVKPTDLMRYLCRLVTPPGGVVLDPFCGSGSTGKAAMLEGLTFIGIELSANYCELAQRRIEAVTKQGLLFT
jgi:site-specific DNA-methyltransferase (adenine-specific)